MVYKGPDSTGVVIKLVKKLGILTFIVFIVVKPSKSQESTILYCEDQETALILWSNSTVLVVRHPFISCYA